jgi:hypothetical protein
LFQLPLDLLGLGQGAPKGTFEIESGNENDFECFAKRGVNVLSDVQEYASGRQEYASFGWQPLVSESIIDPVPPGTTQVSI